MKIRLLTLLIITGMVMSCRSGKLHKKGVNIDQDKQGEISSVLLSELQLAETDFSQVKIKTNVDANLKLFSQKFPMNIQMHKDSVLWASVTMGFELARVKMTPDSLYFLDRFNRTAYLGTWDELSDITRFKFDFGMVQAMVLGNMFYTVEEPDELEIDGNTVIISQLREHLDIQNKWNYDFKKIYEVKGRDLQGNEAEISYQGFVNIEDKLLPTNINLSIINKFADDDIYSTIGIKHADLEFFDHGLSFPFTLPNNYKVVRIRDL